MLLEVAPITYYEIHLLVFHVIHNSLKWSCLQYLLTEIMTSQ